MEKEAKIYVAGHRGLVGSAIVRKLQTSGYRNLVLRTSKELDLRRQAAVEQFFSEEEPEYVIIAAAKVGGILANSRYPAEFFYDNAMIELNLLHSAHQSGVKKLLFLGSSCIYPRLSKQPIQEESLLTGELEKTNEAYAIAKIAGLKYTSYLNQQYQTTFISAMPTNLYGPNDIYHPENSHVLPALIRRFHEAKVQKLPTVTIWGTGTVRREFLYVDDLADACLFLMQNYESDQTINIGTGKDLTIRDLAICIQEIVGYHGQLTFDKTKPDGTPRKLLDVSKLTELGWQAQTSLSEGIRLAYHDFLQTKV